MIALLRLFGRFVLIALIALTLLQFWFFGWVWYWSLYNPARNRVHAQPHGKRS